jgi:hypothetical protein
VTFVKASKTGWQESAARADDPNVRKAADSIKAKRAEVKCFRMDSSSS